MQDNKKVYRIELTNEEYEFLESLLQNSFFKFSKNSYSSLVSSIL